MPTNSKTTLKQIVDFSRRKGFVFPSSEIYGGFAATYDFGPLGILLKKNIENAWRYWNVTSRTDMVEIEGAIFMHPKVWEASGHIGGFSDLMVEDNVTKKRYRADHLIEDAKVKYLDRNLINIFDKNTEDKVSNLTKKTKVIFTVNPENQDKLLMFSNREKNLFYPISFNSTKEQLDGPFDKIFFLEKEEISFIFTSRVARLHWEVNGSLPSSTRFRKNLFKLFLETDEIEFYYAEYPQSDNSFEKIFYEWKDETFYLASLKEEFDLEESDIDLIKKSLRKALIDYEVITNAGSFSAEEVDEIISHYSLKSPDGNPLSKAKKFNLLVQTHLGPVEDETSVAYLKGESCQNIYLDWKAVQETTRKKLPFGIAQIGKAFRNEITVKQFMFRTREFEQMDVQYFVKPGTENDFYKLWKDNRWDFYTQALKFNPENIHYRQHDKDELVFYCVEAWDVEYNFGELGFKELEGLHNRTSYDTDQHSKFSGQDLSYFDPETNTRYNPYIVEMSAGFNRMFLATLFEFYNEEATEGSEETRAVLKFPLELAPFKLAILPLMKKDGLGQKAFEIFSNLRKKGISCDYDEAGSIGKRYRRQDENGTPFCITLDYQTLEDNTVTVRDRDTMVQKRIKIEEIERLISQTK